MLFEPRKFIHMYEYITQFLDTYLLFVTINYLCITYSMNIPRFPSTTEKAEKRVLRCMFDQFDWVLGATTTTKMKKIYQNLNKDNTNNVI